MKALAYCVFLYFFLMGCFVGSITSKKIELECDSPRKSKFSDFKNYDDAADSKAEKFIVAHRNIVDDKRTSQHTGFETFTYPQERRDKKIHIKTRPPTYSDLPTHDQPKWGQYMNGQYKNKYLSTSVNSRFKHADNYLSYPRAVQEQRLGFAVSVYRSDKMNIKQQKSAQSEVLHVQKRSIDGSKRKGKRTKKKKRKRHGRGKMKNKGYKRDRKKKRGYRGKKKGKRKGNKKNRKAHQKNEKHRGHYKKKKKHENDDKYSVETTTQQTPQSTVHAQMLTKDKKSRHKHMKHGRENNELEKGYKKTQMSGKHRQLYRKRNIHQGSVRPTGRRKKLHRPRSIIKASKYPYFRHRSSRHRPASNGEKLDGKFNNLLKQMPVREGERRTGLEEKLFRLRKPHTRNRQLSNRRDKMLRTGPIKKAMHGLFAQNKLPSRWSKKKHYGRSRNTYSKSKSLSKMNGLNKMSQELTKFQKQKKIKNKVLTLPTTKIPTSLQTTHFTKTTDKPTTTVSEKEKESAELKAFAEAILGEEYVKKLREPKATVPPLTEKQVSKTIPTLLKRLGIDTGKYNVSVMISYENENIPVIIECADTGSVVDELSKNLKRPDEFKKSVMGRFKSSSTECLVRRDTRPKHFSSRHDMMLYDIEKTIAKEEFMPEIASPVQETQETDTRIRQKSKLTKSNHKPKKSTQKLHGMASKSLDSDELHHSSDKSSHKSHHSSRHPSQLSTSIPHSSREKKPQNSNWVLRVLVAFLLFAFIICLLIICFLIKYATRKSEPILPLYHRPK